MGKGQGVKVYGRVTWLVLGGIEGSVMQLTRDHRLVQASFDRPMSFKKTQESITRKNIHVTYEFQVGLLVYQAEFFGNREELEVVFAITDIIGTDEEFKDYLSKVRQTEIDLEDIHGIKEEILESPDEDWMVGTSIAVFSTVCKLIEEVVIKHDIKCITFSATSEKKDRVYQRMIKSYFKGWQLKSIPGLGGIGFTFELCR